MSGDQGCCDGNDDPPRASAKRRRDELRSSSASSSTPSPSPSTVARRRRAGEEDPADATVVADEEPEEVVANDGDGDDDDAAVVRGLMVQSTTHWNRVMRMSCELLDAPSVWHDYMRYFHHIPGMMVRRLRAAAGDPDLAVDDGGGEVIQNVMGTIDRLDGVQRQLSDIARVLQGGVAAAAAAGDAAAAGPVGPFPVVAAEAPVRVRMHGVLAWGVAAMRELIRAARAQVRLERRNHRRVAICVHCSLNIVPCRPRCANMPIRDAATAARAAELP